MTKLTINKDYKNWLINIKSKIKNSQIKAALSVNSELISLYWEIGAMIVEKQEKAKWGSGLIKQLSIDLKDEFSNLTGFSKDNLYFMKRFYLFYYKSITIVEQVVQQINEKQNTEENIIIEQLVQQTDEYKISNWKQIVPKIPWGHHILILKKIKNQKEAIFYIKETIENNWSRSVLEYHIETNLYNRQGKAVSNFKNTLPKPESDLAQQLLKDPYNFDLLSLTKRAKEKELEQQLTQNISQFLMELGKGFAYMGKQFLLKVGDSEFRTDLLFYHTVLRAYIVIELKMTKFEPEFVGKLNFYTTAINELLKTDADKPTIGILLCKTKDNIVVDFSLKDIKKPIGVSEFTYNELPEEIKTYLPTENEFKTELNKAEYEQK